MLQPSKTSSFTSQPKTAPTRLGPFNVLAFAFGLDFYFFWRQYWRPSLLQILEHDLLGNCYGVYSKLGNSIGSLICLSQNCREVSVRIYQCIRMIKRSEMRPLGGATFWDNHLPVVTTILTPILVCLKPKILPIRWCHFL